MIVDYLFVVTELVVSGTECSFVLCKVLDHEMDRVNGFLRSAVNKAICTYSSVLHFSCSYTIPRHGQFPRHTMD